MPDEVADVDATASETSTKTTPGSDAPVTTAASQWGDPKPAAPPRKPKDEADEPRPKRSRRRRRSSDSNNEETAPGDAPSDTTPRSAPDESASDAEAGSRERDDDRPKRRRRRRRGESADTPKSDASSDRASSDRETGDEFDDTIDRHKYRTPPAAKPTLEIGSDDWKEIFDGRTFRELGLRETVLKGVESHGFEYATHIQAKLIPPIVEGRDVLGQARTGTGKTAAFGMPIFHSAKRQTPFQTIVLAPTRELAIQIAAELDAIGKWTPIRVAAVYGGKRMDQQVRELETGPDVIVATPGRLIDVVERRVMHLKNVRQIVLDEVDRMLDIGFRDDIRRILSMIKSQRHQTIFVSATISDEIEKLAKSFMTDPVDVRTVTGSLTVSLVDQFYCSVQPWDKRPMLIHLIKNEKPEVAVVFCQMKRTVDKIKMRLKDAGIDAAAIHGDMMQQKRNAIIKKLRAGDLHILVATDLAARGLDVDGITHVVNFDMPEDPEVYIHRIGRTARAGRRGRAFTLVTPEQGDMLTAVELQANAHIEQMVFDDFEPSPEPDNVRAEKKAEEQRTEDAKALNRFAAPKLPGESGAPVADASKFPGGVVPTKLPPKKRGGLVKTSKTMKQAAADAKLREM